MQITLYKASVKNGANFLSYVMSITNVNLALGYSCRQITTILEGLLSIYFLCHLVCWHNHTITTVARLRAMTFTTIFPRKLL